MEIFKRFKMHVEYPLRLINKIIDRLIKEGLTKEAEYIANEYGIDIHTRRKIENKEESKDGE